MSTPPPIGRDLLSPEHATKQKTAPSRGFVFRKIVWVLALIAMALFTIEGFVTIGLQDSAPQQAAAAALACFHMIVPYVLARALDELTRSDRV